MGGLGDKPRSGGAPLFPPRSEDGGESVGFCEPPATHGVPPSRWSAGEVAREAIDRGLAAEISGTTVWRWLSEDAIRPFYHRSWIFPRDPDFAEKASRVLDLYEGRWEGEALGEGEYVIGADEKTSIRARHRRHASLCPPVNGGRDACRARVRTQGSFGLPGRLGRTPGEKPFGRREPKNGIEPFGRLVDEVMREEPYASAERVFWMVDKTAPATVGRLA